MGYPPTPNKQRHDSVIPTPTPSTSNHDDEEEEEEVEIDTDDGHDIVYMRNCDRYSQTKIYYNDDLAVKDDPVTKHRRQPGAFCDNDDDDDCGSWIDERAGESGYVPRRGRIGEWAKGVSSGSSSRNEEPSTESKEAMRSQQMQDWTANRRNREHAAIDGTVRTLEELHAEPVAAVLARQTKAEDRERSYPQSILESDQVESILIMHTTNAWFPDVICQYPLCELPNRNISAVGGTYVSLENLGDGEDLVRGSDIELGVGGAAAKRVAVYTRRGSFGSFKTGSPGVHGTFCIPCLRDLYLKHVAV
ncbi:hypothetical protein HDK77DRAFT_241830 [Phyllosticta capitalensis]|uniref:uncharacterized protein n=1 Tax=Phyllosticta capitalensis TaxID=121624 RepID=UPI00312D2940